MIVELEEKSMDGQWHIRQQLELLSSPTTVQYHRIETYSSIVEGVRRVRRIGIVHKRCDQRVIMMSVLENQIM